MHVIPHNFTNHIQREPGENPQCIVAMHNNGTEYCERDKNVRVPIMYTTQ